MQPFNAGKSIRVQLNPSSISDMVTKAKKQLTETQKETCVTLFKEGKSKVWLANKFGITTRTVYNIVKNQVNLARKKYDSTLRYELIDQEIEDIKNLIDSNEQIKWKELKKELSLPVSFSTISRIVKKEGYVRLKKRGKSCMLKNEKIQQLRLDFCEKYKNWTADQWEQAVFLDESYVQTQHNSKNLYYHTKPKENKTKKYSYYNNKRLKVNFLSSINGLKSKIVFFKDNCNEKVFSDILKNETLFELNLYNPGPFTVFLDNASYHGTTMANDLFAEEQYKHITKVALPPYSNDLNPIENLFGILKNEIQPVLLTVTNKQELEKEVNKVFNKLVEEGHVKTLLRSMPERIQAVFEAKGGPTRF